MNEPSHAFKVGVFIFISTLVLLVFIVMLGTGLLEERGLVFETYMSESVNGLEVGSPIKFRGVRIGKVLDILPARAQHRYALSPYIIIRVEVQPARFGETTTAGLQERLGREVEQGLRVKLASQGITGVLYLELDYLDPYENPPLEFDWQPVHYYIPSAKGTIAQITESLQTILEKLAAVDLKGLTERTAIVLDRSGRAAVNLNRAIRKMDEMADELRGATAHFKKYPSQAIFGEPPPRSRFAPEDHAGNGDEE